jgi:hypothetical protein
VIHKHEEPWRNNIDTGELLICPPELYGNPNSSHLVANHEELREENYEFVFMKYLCSYFEGIFTCRKILRHGADDFNSPPKEGVLRISIALEQINRLSRD